MRREIVYDEQCLIYLVTPDQVKRLDERLAAVEWALWLDAEDFPLIHGFQRLRVARVNGFGVEPTLRIFFEVDNGTVTVKWIEPIDEA